MPFHKPQKKNKEVIFLEIDSEVYFLLNRYKAKFDFKTEEEAINFIILKELNIKTAK